MSKRRAIFVDRSIGRRCVPEALRSAGALVEIHDDHFIPDAPDEEWLELVSRRGWMALTKDSNIGLRTIQRLKVAEYGVRLYVFSSGNLKGGAMADILKDMVDRIQSFDETHVPPYIAKVYASREIRMWRDRDQLMSELERHLDRSR